MSKKKKKKTKEFQKWFESWERHIKGEKKEAK